jgi:hypothetical protein
MFSAPLRFRALAPALLAAGVMAMAGAAPTFAQQAPCQLNADFQTIVAKVGVATIGDCAGDELVGATGGDRFQSTTRGLLIFSVGGNWTAFTDGQTTWVNNPVGLASVSGSTPAPTTTAPSAPIPAQPAQPPVTHPAA